MILIAHILIASSSLILTGYTFLFPSKSKLSAVYALVAATVGSGTYLMILTPAHMVQTCFTGLAYLGLMIPAILIVRRKLAQVESK